MRVLVVEPGERERARTVALVGSLGHECESTADVEAALGLASAGDVDVVLAAVGRSAVDGVELCRRIRSSETGRYTYVVMLATNDEREATLRAIRAGADDYLVHPVEEVRLETRLLAAERVGELHRALRDRQSQLARVNADLEEAVRTDPLTGLYNRRRLAEDQPVLDEGLRRYDRPFAVAMADVDDFKLYNDHYGHQAGDEALRAVASTIRRAVRQGDVAYRYGGEEFLLVFPVQGLARAQIAAERARSAVEAVAIPHRGNSNGFVTISVGVAEATPEGGLAGAIAQADAALYGAKHDGRNRVVLGRSPVPTRIELP